MEAAASSDDQFDRCSTSSSLEIVDALTEAAEETADREESPALSVLSCPDLVVVDSAEMEGFEDAMTQSQYAQVIFDEIEDSYSLSRDLVCSYSLTPGLEQGHGDRVGLYRLPFLQPHESVCYVWAGVGPEADHKVTFPKTKLPKQEDFYQFQYLRGDNSVAGASIPFQLKGEPGDRALKEELGGLETKYSGLLHLSEKLSEELNNKTQSFVVLEQEHKSMCETASRAQQLECDLEELVASSLGLKQTLRATEETLARTESVLEVTTTRMAEAELALETKTVEAARLEARLAEMGDTREERDRLVGMLEQEQTAREGLLKEKAVLLGRLEDGEAMLAAAVKSKDLAVEEIRFQVTRQDELMKEMSQSQDNVARAEADLVEYNRETQVKDALVSSLGRRLEETERKMMMMSAELEILRMSDQGQGQKVTRQDELMKELSQSQDNVARAEADLVEYKRETQENYVSLGKQLEENEGQMMLMSAELEILREGDQTKKRDSLAITEKCLEDADRRAEVLEKEKKALEEVVTRMQQEKLELKARLEAGATHYRKMVVAKEKLEKQQIESSASALEEQVRQLKDEVRASRNVLEAYNSGSSRQISGASSLSRTIADESAFSSISNNMDSMKIGRALDGTDLQYSEYQTPSSAVGDPIPEKPPAAPFKPSLFQPFAPMEPRLPPPLLPEVTHPDTSTVPELRPREPAPYSSIQEPKVGFASVSQGSGDGIPGGQGEGQREDASGEGGEVHCPWCMKAFPAGGAELDIHVEQHLAEVLDCPICGKMFEKTKQRVFEEHVQDHFKEQGGNMVDISIRGWDLGID